MVHGGDVTMSSTPVAESGHPVFGFAREEAEDRAGMPANSIEGSVRRRSSMMTRCGTNGRRVGNKAHHHRKLQRRPVIEEEWQ